MSRSTTDEHFNDFGIILSSKEFSDEYRRLFADDLQANPTTTPLSQANAHAVRSGDVTQFISAADADELRHTTLLLLDQEIATFLGTLTTNSNEKLAAEKRRIHSEYHAVLAKKIYVDMLDHARDLAASSIITSGELKETLTKFANSEYRVPDYINILVNFVQDPETTRQARSILHDALCDLICAEGDDSRAQPALTSLLEKLKNKKTSTQELTELLERDTDIKRAIDHITRVYNYDIKHDAPEYYDFALTSDEKQDLQAERLFRSAYDYLKDQFIVMKDGKRYFSLMSVSSKAKITSNDQRKEVVKSVNTTIATFLQMQAGLDNTVTNLIQAALSIKDEKSGTRAEIFKIIRGILTACYGEQRASICMQEIHSHSQHLVAEAAKKITASAGLTQTDRVIKELKSLADLQICRTIDTRLCVSVDSQSAGGVIYSHYFGHQLALMEETRSVYNEFNSLLAKTHDEMETLYRKIKENHAPETSINTADEYGSKIKAAARQINEMIRNRFASIPRHCDRFKSLVLPAFRKAFSDVGKLADSIANRRYLTIGDVSTIDITSQYKAFSRALDRVSAKTHSVPELDKRSKLLNLLQRAPDSRFNIAQKALIRLLHDVQSYKEEMMRRPKLSKKGDARRWTNPHRVEQITALETHLYEQLRPSKQLTKATVQDTLARMNATIKEIKQGKDGGLRLGYGSLYKHLMTNKQRLEALLASETLESELVGSAPVRVPAADEQHEPVGSLHASGLFATSSESEGASPSRSFASLTVYSSVDQLQLLIDRLRRTAEILSRTPNDATELARFEKLKRIHSDNRIKISPNDGRAIELHHNYLKLLTDVQGTLQTLNPLSPPIAHSTPSHQQPRRSATVAVSAERPQLETVPPHNGKSVSDIVPADYSMDESRVGTEPEVAELSAPQQLELIDLLNGKTQRLLQIHADIISPDQDNAAGIRGQLEDLKNYMTRYDNGALPDDVATAVRTLNDAISGTYSDYIQNLVSQGAWEQLSHPVSAAFFESTPQCNIRSMVLTAFEIQTHKNHISDNVIAFLRAVKSGTAHSIVSGQLQDRLKAVGHNPLDINEPLVFAADTLNSARKYALLVSSQHKATHVALTTLISGLSYQVSMNPDGGDRLWDLVSADATKQTVLNAERFLDKDYVRKQIWYAFSLSNGNDSITPNVEQVLQKFSEMHDTAHPIFIHLKSALQARIDSRNLDANNIHETNACQYADLARERAIQLMELGVPGAAAPAPTPEDQAELASLRNHRKRADSTAESSGSVTGSDDRGTGDLEVPIVHKSRSRHSTSSPGATSEDSGRGPSHSQPSSPTEETTAGQGPTATKPATGFWGSLFSRTRREPAFPPATVSSAVSASP